MNEERMQTWDEATWYKLKMDVKAKMGAYYADAIFGGNFSDLELLPLNNFIPLCRNLEMCDLCASDPNRVPWSRCTFRKRD